MSGSPPVSETPTALSASERLRELKAAQIPGEWPLEDDIFTLYEALPFIAEVVAAAETAQETARIYQAIPLPGGGHSGRVRYPLRDALTALRDFLGAEQPPAAERTP